MEDLEFLSDCNSEELEMLADILRNKGGFTSSLRNKGTYKNQLNYVKAIATELLDFGSNTLWYQKDYRTILEDVCDKMDVPYTSRQSVVQIENELLGNILGETWKKTSEAGRRTLLESMDENATIAPGGATTAFSAIFRAGGFRSYQLSVVIANSVAKFAVGRGLSFGANALLTKALSVISGQIGVLMGAWTVVQITGPAYRVTVPAVTYVASLRNMCRNRQYARR